MCVRNEKENGARIADGEAKIKKKKKFTAILLGSLARPTAAAAAVVPAVIATRTPDL